MSTGVFFSSYARGEQSWKLFRSSIQAIESKIELKRKRGEDTSYYEAKHRELMKALDAGDEVKAAKVVYLTTGKVITIRVKGKRKEISPLDGIQPMVKLAKGNPSKSKQGA